MLMWVSGYVMSNSSCRSLDKSLDDAPFEQFVILCMEFTLLRLLDGGKCAMKSEFRYWSGNTATCRPD